jgi:Nif-specific regulatory protein
MSIASRKLEVSQPRNSSGLFSTRASVALVGVYEISKILAVPARLETTLSNVLMLLSSFLEMRHGLIALLDEQGDPDVVVGLGWNEANAKLHFERLPERAIGQIVTTQMPLVVPNVEADPLLSDWAAAEKEPGQSRISFIGVPIRERDRVIGTLTIDRVWDGETTHRLDEDVRFLVMISNLLGQTLRLHNLVLRDRERLMAQQHRLEKALSATAPVKKPREPLVKGIVGDSAAIRSVLGKIKIAARSNATVLLRGESGTGKELFARAAHDLSPRKDGPFIRLNCAALPETMLETELFGHEKGAFTGAIAQRKGRFELAHGGTLFLDEIGEISLAFQAKLLRVLQEGEFERVGGMKTLKADVRLVAATNRNLEDAVMQREFRADLYYRINVISIQLPPLRERQDDVFPLASEFLRRFNEEHGMQSSFTYSAREVLEGCSFPGNVRELENCVRRTATMARDCKITAGDFACRNDACLSATLWKGAIRTAPAFNILPKGSTNVASPVCPEKEAPPAAESYASAPLPEPAGADEDAEENSQTASGRGRILHGDGLPERRRLIDAMERAGWVQAKAARLLNVTPRQIGYALRKHGVEVKKF